MKDFIFSWLALSAFFAISIIPFTGLPTSTEAIIAHLFVPLVLSAPIAFYIHEIEK